jgi:ribonuclease D
MSLEERNAEALADLREKVDEIVADQEAEKARRLAKAKENQKKLDALREELEQIAKQSGISPLPEESAQEAEKSINWTERHDFFIPTSRRDRFMDRETAELFRGDR